MKVMYSLPDSMVEKIKTASKDMGATRSSVVNTALTIYFLMYAAEPNSAKALQNMIPKGQTDIFEFMEGQLVKNRNK